MTTIPKNDGKLTEADNKVIEMFRSQIVNELKTKSVVQCYNQQYVYAEAYCKILGKEFTSAGYYVAYDYVNGKFRNIIVSKMPIGEPSGRLVSRTWE